LAELLPVEFTRQEQPLDPAARTHPFRPLLTYDGERSGLLALADDPAENLRLWKDELWQNGVGFHWHYPVTGLKPGASALLVHPQKRVGRPPDERPMPLVAHHRYGKGEVLFVGTDETWRWRDGTGDRLTARFWGQVVSQLGLPHLLGNSKRTLLDLERGTAVLGQPGSAKARLLGPSYDPLRRSEVPAVLVHVDARDARAASQALTLRRVRGQPGEYRVSLPNDAPGRFELRVPAADGVEGATLPFRVELPPRHELEEAGLAEDELRSLA